MTLWVILISFIVILSTGASIGVGLGLSSAIVLYCVLDMPLVVVVQRMFTSVDSFSFFIDHRGSDGRGCGRRRARKGGKEHAGHGNHQRETARKGADHGRFTARLPIRRLRIFSWPVLCPAYSWALPCAL